MRRKFLLGIGVVCLVGGMAILSVPAAERVIDETIQAIFQRAHSVMKDLRADLQAVMDGFLASDLTVIQERANRIASKMNQVARRYPPESGDEVEEWKALADIVEQARLLQQKANSGHYQAAYQHYTLLAQRCISCHQVRRQWGKFSDPQTSQPVGGAQGPSSEP